MSYSCCCAFENEPAFLSDLKWVCPADLLKAEPILLIYENQPYEIWVRGAIEKWVKLTALFGS